MALSEGEKVRCYHSPTSLWEVVETEVERDHERPEDCVSMYRVPGADTLLRNTRKPNVYMVCASSMLKPRSEEVSSA